MMQVESRYKFEMKKLSLSLNDHENVKLTVANNIYI